MCGKELKKAAGTVVKKLGKWLQEKGYVRPEIAAEVIDSGATAARELPATEGLACMLADYADCTAVDCDEAIEDHFTIEAVEPGKLHLSSFSENDMITVSVSPDISDACCAG